MRESKAFVKFFQSNFWLTTLPMVLFATLGGYLFFQSPPVYKTTKIVEFIYQDNPSDEMALADQAVTLLRSANLAKEFSLEAGVTIEALKIAPLTIQLSALSNVSPNLANQALLKSVSFLNQKYQLKPVGQDIQSVAMPSVYLGVLLGGLIGLGMGLFFSLVKSYFQKY